jgi:cytochrome P450
MKTIPVFRGLPLLGVLPGLALDTVGLFLRAAREVGPLVRLGRRGPILVAHPADLRHVLKDNARNYVRGHTVDRIRPLLGNGLPLSDGEPWLRRRRLMQPSFQRDRVDALVTTMSAVAGRHLDALVPGRRLLAHDLMRRIAQEVIVETMFSDSLGADTPALDQALNTIEDYVSRWGFIPLTPPRWLPDQRRFQQAVATIDRVLQRIIAARRGGEPGSDLLGGLLRAQEGGAGLSDRELRDEAVNIFFAGHETTANALTWAVYLLHQHPAAQERLTAEVDQVLGGRAPTAADLRALPYTTAVVRETLRLYPSAWIFAREAVADDTLRDHAVPAGSVLLLSMLITHRMPDLWPDPMRFDPERFLPPNQAPGDYAYLPFGGGAHLCIGNHFALAEAAAVLAMLCQRGRLQVLRPEAVRPRASATLKVADGLPVTFARRS